MAINIRRFTKNQLLEYVTGRCKHRHTYAEHPQCWEKEHGDRCGYFDIEATNLNADFGIMLGYKIYDPSEQRMYGRFITAKELRSEVQDEMVLRNLYDDMKEFDRLVTYYGTGFDMKFSRTRAFIKKTPFPLYGEIRHTDVYYMVKRLLKLSSKKLGNACQHVLGRSNKTPLNGDIWTRALTGHKESLDYIEQHCEYDVTDLHDLHIAIQGFTKGEGANSL